MDSSGDENREGEEGREGNEEKDAGEIDKKRKRTSVSSSSRKSVRTLSLSPVSDQEDHDDHEEVSEDGDPANDPTTQTNQIESEYKSGPWEYEEDERLIQAIEKLKKPDGNVNWAEVTKFMIERSQKQCYVRWNTLLKYRGMGVRRGAWTPEEDAKLSEAVSHNQRKGGGVYWGKVSEEMGGDRTYQQCLKRWKQVLQPVGSGTKTGAWTDDEDSRLIEAMSHFDGQGKRGGVDWSKVSEYLGGERAASQCYKRWHDALKQRRKSSLGEDWTPEEDMLVIQAVSISAGEGLGGGVDWNTVSDHLDNTKTAKQCNKRWNRVLKIKDGVEGRIRTDPWEPEEERMLLKGVESCQIAPVDDSSSIFDSMTESKVDTDIPSDHTFVDSRQFQDDLYQQDQSQKQTTASSEVSSRKYVSFYHLYPSQSELAPGEIHIKSIDWNRVSQEFLGGHRTPRQCEKRFEGLQRQRLRSGHYEETPFSGPVRDSLGNENHFEAEGDDHRSSLNSISSTPSRNLEGGSGSAYHRHRGRVVKTGPWLPEEDEKLIEAVSLHEGQGRGGAVDWGRVCEYMGGDRTYDQCRVRWNGVLKIFKNRGTVVKMGPWGKSEDEKLIEAVGNFEGVGKGGGVDWEKVSEYLHGERTPNQCHTRWNSVLKHRGTAVKSSPWTDLEDIKLTEAVGAYDGLGRGGTVDWSKVSEHMGGDRSSYQHRMRWHSVLKNRVIGSSSTSRSTTKKDIVLEPWDPREIQILLNAIELCAKVNPFENANITQESGYGVHQRQSHNTHHPPQETSFSSTEAITTHHVGDTFAVPGPLTAAAQDGAMIGHTVDWIGVANRVSDEYSNIGNGVKRSPLQCLYMWRMVINSRLRMPTTPSDFGIVDLDDARMIPGNSFALNRNSQWTDMEDEKLTEAVGLYDGQGRGGGVDWAKVCEFMGSIRTYNQCRHRWHNVIKHRAYLLTQDQEMQPGGRQQLGPPDWAALHHQHLSLQHQLLDPSQCHPPGDDGNSYLDSLHHDHHSQSHLDSSPSQYEL